MPRHFIITWKSGVSEHIYSETISEILFALHDRGLLGGIAGWREVKEAQSE